MGQAEVNVVVVNVVVVVVVVVVVGFFDPNNFQLNSSHP